MVTVKITRSNAGGVDLVVIQRNPGCAATQQYVPHPYRQAVLRDFGNVMLKTGE